MNPFCEDPTERQKPSGMPKTPLAAETLRFGMS